MSEDELVGQFTTYVSHQLPRAENIEQSVSSNPIFGGALTPDLASIGLNYEVLMDQDVSQR